MDWNTLKAEWSGGTRPVMLPFWGHQPAPDGSPGPGCLSQFWPSPFEIDDQLYLSAEHWMMASKARLFGDQEVLDRILTSVEPRAAKALGRQVRGFDEATWRAHRVALVTQGNLAKFRHHEAERRYLLSTAPAVLVEASPYDRIWGVGLSASEPALQDPHTWRGQNLLGFVLMAVRDTLG